MKEVSNWIDRDGYSLLCLKGTDPNFVENRLALIEKSPRIRVKEYTEENDWKNWKYGNKRDDNFNSVSRSWCEEELKQLGYIFS